MAFTHYTEFTVNTGQVPSTQTDFPALISVTDNRFKLIANGGHVHNGNDIRLYDSTGLSALKYEKVGYNGTAGTIEFYAKIASFADASKARLYYGDSALSSDGTDLANTWSNNFLGVYHFGDGTTLSLNDSSGNGNHLTGTNTPTAGTGKVGGAIALASASSQRASRGSVTGAIAMSSSVWLNPTSLPTLYQVVTQYTDGSAAAVHFPFYTKSTARTAAYARATTLIGHDEVSGSVVGTGSWQHFAHTYDSTVGLSVYLSGAHLPSSPVAANGNLGVGAHTIHVGGDGTASQYFNGLIDEWRLSTVRRTTDWILTEYRNTNAPGTFWSMGTEQAISVAESFNGFSVFNSPVFNSHVFNSRIFN